MEFIDVNLDAVFNEIMERRETQGMLSREDFYELIDEVLEEKRSLGEMSDDTNFDSAKEMLRRRWSEIANDKV